MIVTRVQETAEAVCGALHRVGWRYIGEEDASTWFVRGDEWGRRVRIKVERSPLDPVVNVQIEWHNLSMPPETIRCAQLIQIGCSSEFSRIAVENATERAVLRCLEIFRDVLGGTGVASENYLKTARRLPV